MVLFQGEKEAIERVLDAGRHYGFGNMIAHLGREWAKSLVENYGFSEDAAMDHARAHAPGAYPLDWHQAQEEVGGPNA